MEGVLGISSARNRALNHAIEQGFDFLVYVDDDEFVEPNWLVTLLAERDRLELDIIGSPVRPKPFDENLTILQKLVWSGIKRSGYNAEKRCRRKCAAGRGDSIKVATGSWMGRLDFFRNTGLRFDSHFGLTGVKTGTSGRKQNRLAQEPAGLAMRSSMKQCRRLD